MTDTPTSSAWDASPSRIPEFARKILEGRESEVRWCITCQECTTLLGSNKRVGCTIYDKEYRQFLPKK